MTGRSQPNAGGAEEVRRRRAEFELLMREHEPVMVGTARRLCGARAVDAEDLVQDAFVRAYVAYCDGRFEAGTNARAWLVRILTNLFINDYNRAKRRPLISLDATGDGREIDPPAPAADEPSASVLGAALDEPLERALAEISAPLRACVVLVDVEGMEYAEAAAALGVPIGTVRSRLARARLQLHTLLYEYARERRRV